MESGLISIIIPVYNVEKYLKDCLDSVIAQTYSNWEAICVDNGSTDKSLEILKEYARNDNRIKIFTSEKGVSKARNCGLDNAKGYWITFVDSDDVLHKDYIKNLYKAVTKNNVEFAWCKNKTFKDDEWFTPDISNTATSVEGNLLDLLVNNSRILYNAVWGKLFSVKSINKMRFPENVAIAEDKIFSLLYCINNSKGVYISQELYGYRIRENSATTKHDITKQLQIIEGEKFCLEKVANKIKNIRLKQKIIKKSVNEIYASAITRPFKDLPNTCIENWNITYEISSYILRNNVYMKKLSIKKKIIAYLFVNKRFTLLKAILNLHI